MKLKIRWEFSEKSLTYQKRIMNTETLWLTLTFEIQREPHKWKINTESYICNVGNNINLNCSNTYRVVWWYFSKQWLVNTTQNLATQECSVKSLNMQSEFFVRGATRRIQYTGSMHRVPPPRWMGGSRLNAAFVPDDGRQSPPMITGPTPLITQQSPQPQCQCLRLKIQEIIQYM